MTIFYRFIAQFFPTVLILLLALSLVRCNEDEETVLPAESNSADSLQLVNDDEAPIVASDSVVTDSANRDSTTTSADTTQSPPPDTTSAGATARQRVIRDYEENFLAAEADLSTWNGSVDDCRPGKLPKETLNNILKHINYFRRQAGLNDDIYFSDEKNKKCQAAALMMHANGNLNHSPPEDWQCYITDGAKAASKSNLASTTSGRSSVSIYIKDYGSSNKDLGHRRWILYSRAKEMGFGSTSRYNALWVIGDHARNPIADSLEYIAWPPAGHVIDRLVYDRWSLSIPKANFSESQVSMENPEGKVSLSVHRAKKGYGDNTLMWEPDVQKPTQGEDATYRVTVSNVVVDGIARDYTYEVIIVGYDY